MGYVFDFENTKKYDQWFMTPMGKGILELEKTLLKSLLKPLPGERLLDVGCGTGIFLEWFTELGYFVTGIEPSPYMLDMARKRMGHRATLYRGYAEDLPFDDNEFDVVTLITTLEFVDDPLVAIAEAIRVARKRLVIGVLNRYSLASVRRCLFGQFRSNSIYSHARFFSVFELKKILSDFLSDSEILWRTVLFFPKVLLPYLCWLERTSYFQYNPFGSFIGMSVEIRPLFSALQDPMIEPVHSSSGGITPKPTFYTRLPEIRKEAVHEGSKAL